MSGCGVPNGIPMQTIGPSFSPELRQALEKARHADGRFAVVVFSWDYGPAGTRQFKERWEYGTKFDAECKLHFARRVVARLLNVPTEAVTVDPPDDLGLISKDGSHASAGQAVGQGDDGTAG